MSDGRKSAINREKEFRLAILRIQKGRSKNTTAKKLSIASVAAEVGVSAALIHNHYPSVAEQIRLAQGRESRALRDAKQDQLNIQIDKNKQLLKEMAELRAIVRRLASLNEVLRIENGMLNAKLNNPIVSGIT